MDISVPIHNVISKHLWLTYLCVPAGYENNYFKMFFYYLILFKKWQLILVHWAKGRKAGKRSQCSHSRSKCECVHLTLMCNSLSDPYIFPFINSQISWDSWEIWNRCFGLKYVDLFASGSKPLPYCGMRMLPSAERPLYFLLVFWQEKDLLLLYSGAVG